VFAEALVNRDVDYEKLKKDYFTHAYGEDWEAALSYFDRMTELIKLGFEGIGADIVAGAVTEQDAGEEPVNG